jgi:hypothetical protein
MLFVQQRGHCSVDHLTLEPRESPRLSSKLHNPLHRDLDTFLLSRISKVLDGANDFFNYSAGSGVDALFSTTARERCEQRLLTPNCLFACALVANMVAHGSEQRVRLVIASAQAEQERTKDSVRDKLRHRVRNVGSSNLSRNLLGHQKPDLNAK